jgi:hypothetical protein
MTPIPTTNSQRDKSRISLQIFRINAITIVVGPKEVRASRGGGMEVVDNLKRGVGDFLNVLPRNPLKSPDPEK